jgi:hypothetical protein
MSNFRLPSGSSATTDGDKLIARVELGIQCMAPFEMLRRERVRFLLAAQVGDKPPPSSEFRTEQRGRDDGILEESTRFT